jgi:hypothetical protein
MSEDIVKRLRTPLTATTSCRIIATLPAPRGRDMAEGAETEDACERATRPR